MYCHVLRGRVEFMSATCVLWYVLRADMGLSKHGNPVFPHSLFPHCCPLNQNLACVGKGGAGTPNRSI